MVPCGLCEGIGLWAYGLMGHGARSKEAWRHGGAEGKMRKRENREFEK